MHNGPSSEPPPSRPCGMPSCLNVIINFYISLLETRPIRSGSPVNGIQMLRPEHRESRDEVPMGMGKIDYTHTHTHTHTHSLTPYHSACLFIKITDIHVHVIQITVTVKCTDHVQIKWLY